MDVAINAIGLLGVLLLAAPAVYANKYGRLIARLKSAGPIDPIDPRAQEIHGNALKALEDHRGNWTPALSRCLIGGTSLAAFSYVLGLIKALSELCATG